MTSASCIDTILVGKVLAWALAVFSNLDISNNPGINGTIATKPFANTLVQPLHNLILSGTNLSGPMFDTAGLSFVFGARLHAQRTQYLNFCARLLNGTSRAAWRPIETMECDLDGTPACECPELYPLCTSYSCPPNDYFGQKPSLEFVCMEGKWASATNVLDSRLIIYGPGKAIITGNLTSSDLVLSSLNSSVIVQGCANNLSSVTIELTPEQLKQLQPSQLQSLVTLEGSSAGCSDFSLSSLRVNITGSSCKKLKAAKTSNTAATLSGVFTLDNSKCKLWWIILVAVVCGMIFLALFIFLLLVTLVPSIRHKVRPYTQALDSRRTQAKRDTAAPQAHARGSESDD